MRLQRLLCLLVAWTALGRTAAWAQCNPAGTTVTLDYSTYNTTNTYISGSWINRPAGGVPNANSFTQAGTTYTTSDNNSTLVTGSLNGATLVWTATEPDKTTANSTVTYNFSRPVSNVSVRVRDIDANLVAAGLLGSVLTPSHGFTDEVLFTGANGTTAVTPTLAKANPGSTFVTISGNVATGSETAGNTDSPVDGTVTATFPNPITSLTLRYRNVTSATNLDGQAVGIDQLSWCRITPTASNVTTATIPSSASQTSIAPLTGTADGTPAYTVTSLPVNGTLFYNSTGTTYAPVTMTTALTPTQASTLRYAPNAAYMGTSTTFAYQVRDDANLISTTATYTIPLQYVAPCATAAATLDFSVRNAGEDWKTHAAISVPAASTLTTVSSGNYTTGATVANSGSGLQIGAVNGATSLAWSNRYSSTTAGTGTAPGAGRSSSVTFTFNRPVSNFTVQVQDIDYAAGNFTDQVVFSGANGTATVTPTLTAMNPTTGSVAISGNTATGRDYNTSSTVDGTVTAYFAAPILSLTITYNNATNSGTISSNQGIGIDNMTWCRLVPVANNVTTATVPSTATQVGIAGLSGTADGAVASYTVTSLPANGTLFYNSTGTTYTAVTTSTVLTAAQAASLRYTPNAAYTGASTTFAYQVRDDAGLVSANAATYTIPLANTACATATGTLNFSGRPAGEDWKAHASLAVPTGSSRTTVSTSGYTTPTTVATSTLLTANQNNVQTLQWLTDYANQTDNTSSVTFTFNRAVSNFAVRVQDIDRFDDGTNAFTDQVTFVGANGTTAVTPVLGPASANTNTVLISGNVATGRVNNFSADSATVIAYFPSPITSLTLTYRNIETTQTNPANNALGIDLLSFCRLAPVASNITNPSRPSGQGAAPINALSATADGTVASYTITGLDASQGTFYLNGVALTNNQTLTAAQASQLSFAPAALFSGTAGFGYTATDDAGVVSNVATYSVPVTDSGASGTPAACANPGKNGNATGLSGVVNTYFAGTASVAASTSATTIPVAASVGSGTGIAVGDLLLVIQMQGADLNTTNDSNYGANDGSGRGNLTNANFIAGTYEYVVATTALAANTAGAVGVAKLTNSYATAAATTTSPRKSYQVVRIPQYANVTLGGQLNALAWNGSAGGILALDVAGTLTLNGQTLNAAGLGFRGGAGFRYAGAAGLASTDYRTLSSQTANGTKGEGTAGTPRYTLLSLTGPIQRTDNMTNSAAFAAGVTNGYPSGDNGKGAPGNAGGGGTDGIPTNNGFNAGGAGGANGGVGGLGGWPRINGTVDMTDQAVGGSAFSAASSARLVLGGGGGAGSSNDGDGDVANSGIYSSGAPGGGLILVRTGSISGTGTANASGDGNYLLDASGNGTNDGTGGGGAGGTVLITAATPTGLAGLTVLANGGNGASNKNANDVAHGPGGGGGGGVILANGALNAASSAVGGAAGTITSSDAYTGTTYGAATGAAGVTNTGISSSIANSTVGANCVADVATVITAPTNPVGAGQTATLNVAFTNNGPLAASNVSRQVQLPAGLTNVVIQDASNAVITGAAYNATTGLVTYPVVALLASGDNTASSVITFTAPATATVAATSTIGTATPEVVTANNTSTLTLNVTPMTDVTTTLAGPLALNAGQPSGTFTATYTNNGPSPASQVTQKVTLPAGVTNVLVNGVAYTPTGNVIDFGTAATLASGATNTFTYSFTAPTTTGSLAQTSNVTTTTGESNTANNSATFTSTVGAVTDVSTTIQAANAAVATGQTGTFNVTFANAGPSSATSPTLQVQLPAGLSGVTITGTSAGTTGSYNATTGLVTYTYGTMGTALPSGTTIASAINFTVPTTGSVTATAAIATATSELGRTSNNAATATITATPGADVATIITGPASTVAGTMTTYSVVTTNNGPSPATTVAQMVQLPTNLANVFVANGGTYNSATGVVTFPSLGTLVSGTSVNNTISFVAPTSTITATASVATAATDAVTGNNSSTATTSVTTPAANNPTANVYTTITTPSADVAPGTALTFTVVAGNAGPSAAAGVVERVSLPPGLTGVTVSNGGTYDPATGVVTFSQIASLASGTTTTYTVTVNAPPAGLLSATASIAATTNDPVVANNLATTDVTVNAPGDVATALTGPTEVGAGQALTYTVTTTNNGLVPAANVVQTVTIPAGLSSVTLSGSATYNSLTGVVTFPALASQAAGSSVVNTISYAAPGATRLVNVATVSTDSPDNVRTNNRSAVTTLVDPISDVTVAISGPSTIVQGNQVDYAVVTTNNGPSNAASVATRVQLPPGLGTITLSAGGSYDNTTGIVTFSTIASQLPGSAGTVTNIIRFVAPSNLSQLNATATVSAAATAEESNYTNNTASIITAETAPTTIRTDLSTNVMASPNPPTAGQTVKFTVTTTNASASTGTATGVVQRVALEAGLTISAISNGGTYDPVTGVVTFPAISLPAGITQTNTIDVVVSGTTPLQVRALVTGDQSDPDLTNNTRFLNLAVTPAADVATAVSGPTTVATGDAVTYSVLTLNNGPSPAASVAQTVTIPVGLASASVTITGGGTYDASTGLVTFPVITSEIPGSGGQVMNTISFTAPSTTYTVVGNVSTTTAEPATPGAANNTSTVTVAPGNLAPVANAVVNALQTPQGNTAGPLLISPLSATDANGNNTIASYTLTSIPNATTQGILSLNGTALAVNSVILAANAANLRFDPVASFVGNAFFGYTATDNAGVVSAAPALYTIPVGQDNASRYAATSVKATGQYQTNDVLAYAIDPNGAIYNGSGLVYNASGTTTNILAAGSSNGLASTVRAASGNGPAASGNYPANPTNELPAGVSLDPNTGLIYVSDRTLLVNNPTTQYYQVNVITTDVYGGVTTTVAQFTLGASPLPVELVQFDARAVQNRDAQLSWTTASELNNAYFNVERSLDGATFSKVGQVAGQGTKATATTYAFTDAGIGPRVASGQPVYYRLQQVDASGTASYSPVRSVSFTQPAALALTLYPNPAATATGLDLSALPASGTYQVLLLDATGRQVRQLTLGGGLVQQLELRDLATGSYQVLVSGQRPDGSVLRQVLRLVKE